MNRVIALIVAAGKGERAGSGVPKQFRKLAGKTVVAHAYDRLAAHPAIDGVLVVGDEEPLRAALGDRPLLGIAPGGATRRLSVGAGLDAIEALGGTGIVLIHDAARPFVPPAVIDRLLAALETSPGAVPALPVADTLAQHGALLGDVVDRDALVRVQTPQAFRFDDIMTSHRAWTADREPTDDAQMARAAGYEVTLVAGDPMLEKITRPEDFAMAEARYGQRSFRTGTGFDVHRLVEGEKLWLGGVPIPHAKGLAGHSDADVALHALTDAILGAIAEGDIGTHFPPGDPQWRGVPSSRFVEHAAALVEQHGGRIEHVDLTIICEAPKIGPYRDAMRARIAELLRLAPGRISVKATTTERLGFTGRGEGIAAQAAATISLYEDFR
ncbi:bifunctional 2-C-methyl-D-erythritol 4-phosphate cytidylyltransferase/2-C-methyl-D-erythritol 2,4-cyclodiphosphate synthase [Sphingomonas sp.]|uniref:bifunctional 2-C-methyl-D-erythritol 4-phosphate cytidylyltransferase/2-C-methyl-D-erythritol 2,4-cyclodiphosphate synthase n=1 Tax=Sphingomonas sp. TaxID=28214 RepID=UPI002DBE753F|nr:bifunctional 2-C-methyl-D-erythritol 4-phosphate cytidylyltransferase/2-C-methyl-D-erythritol 2,4-cyclodiphosphate synthase [Sphingomonas sp.]HEU4967749.1 bifunctional 2-C-methyl-D-erythritol 4-phosphate cytidylyltransferase/2-C-methyl-D-erythritol 2,4-cyclodiphosphate synthase [Sphingomonas sp.]